MYSDNKYVLSLYTSITQYLLNKKIKSILLNYSSHVGGVETSNLCNHRVAKTFPASRGSFPEPAKSSGGESTLLLISPIQAVENRFVFVCSPRF